MSAWRIYHNPKCSKSRQALQVLEASGVPHQVIRYLDEPLDRATLERLVHSVDTGPASLIRKKELAKFDAQMPSGGDEIVALLVEHGALMERPLVDTGREVVLCRPPEKLSALLS